VNKRGFVRKAIVSVVFMAFLTALAFGGERASLSPGAPVAEEPLAQVMTTTGDAAPAPALGASSPAPSGVAPLNPVFYDKPLMLKQYGYGMLASVVAGSFGFYIGNAFEGAIFGGHSRKGYLSFTGIRYEHSRSFLGMPAGGPFLGGFTGVYLGSALTVFFVGDMDEEQGGVWTTLAGGALTTAAAFALADVAGVQEERGMLAFVPLLALPSVGAVGGYHVSRWFNDRKRRRITEPAADGPVLHAPKLGMAPGPDGMVMRLDALHLTF
jgi:hypothetical protein